MSDTDADSTQPAYATDAPLTSPSQDRLARGDVAKKIAESILRLDASNGYAVGVQGSWGSGKSTFLNFVRYHLDNRLPDRPVTVSFNPWWFASAHDLLGLFLREMSGSVRRSDGAKALSRAADAIEGFGRLASGAAVVPKLGTLAAFTGTCAGWTGRLMKKRAEARASDLGGTREAIVGALKAQNRRVVVFVDDLDRLHRAELKQMFAIIKAVANFPNTVYVLAYDAERVIKQLGDERDYLAKIVQTTVDLPLPTPAQMVDLLNERLNTIVEDEVQAEEKERLANAYVNGLLRLLRTPRDINRYTNAVAFAYPAIRREVCVPDFLAMECIHTVSPTLHLQIRDNVSLYAGSTESRTWEVAWKPEERRELYEKALSGESQQNRVPLLDLLKLLFPKVSVSYGGSGYGNDWLDSWRRDKRCCSPDVFPVYFSLLPPSGYFTETDYEALMALTGNAFEFEAALHRLASERLHDATGSRLGTALDALLTHDKEGFRPIDPEAALVALANLTEVPNLPQDFKEVMLDGLPMNEFRAWWLAKSVLLRQEDPAELFSRVAGASRSLFAPVDWLQSCETRLESGQTDRLHPKDVVLDEAGLRQVTAVVVAKLKVAAEDGRLLQHPRAFRLLLSWEAWEEAAAQSFVQSTAETDTGLVTLLTPILDGAVQAQVDFRHDHLSRDMAGLSKLADLGWLKKRAAEVLNSDLELSDVERSVLTAMADWAEGGTRNNQQA